MSHRYTALRRLTIPSPGNVPSSIDLEPGDVFSLDGNEGIHLDQLLQIGAIKLTRLAKPKPAPKPKGRGD